MNEISGFVPTKGSLKRKNTNENFEQIVFTERKVKRKTTILDNKLDSISTDKTINDKPYDIRKLRYEVIRFGTAGLNPVDKEASSVALAVALGAKPPKNKNKNYKEILKSKSETITNSRNKRKPVKAEQNKHLFVIGKKVVPAKPKSDETMKKFLDGYGRPGKAKFRGKKKH